MQLQYDLNCPYEAGVDEAGRGCLAGPVVAAAVILPLHFNPKYIKDSKKLNFNQRVELRDYIIDNCISYGIASTCNEIIDEINILNASIAAMHKALSLLSPAPEHVVVDGNRFKPWHKTPYTTVVKGDDKLVNVAAASILAKTFRDEIMNEYHKFYPYYSWYKNKGYPTEQHQKALLTHGLSPIHRKTFQLKAAQLSIF